MSTESGHWYKRDGSPCYEIPKKTGGTRSVNLAWDKPLGLVPSVTTVLQIMPKPQLAIWKENQMMLAALTLPRIEGETDEDFCKRVRVDAFQQVKDACDIGTMVHDACEAYYKGEPVSLELLPYVEGVVSEVSRIFPEVTDWVSEKYFAHTVGFGGKCDLHSPSTGIVIDFKGKDGDFTDGKKLAYDQHFQLSAYQTGLELPPAPCANIFFSRTHPGATTSVIWNEDQLMSGWDCFCHCLALWKCIKKYDPSFKKEEI